jgi:hypothetical protein
VQKRILIVEDETDLVKLLRYSLEKEGFRVSYATDGAQRSKVQRGEIVIDPYRKSPPTFKPSMESVIASPRTAMNCEFFSIFTKKIIRQ